MVANEEVVTKKMLLVSHVRISHVLTSLDFLEVLYIKPPLNTQKDSIRAKLTSIFFVNTFSLATAVLISILRFVIIF